MMEKVREQSSAEQAVRWTGPRWLWFGTLGGSLAWGTHLLAAWAVVELGCSFGSATVLGLPLRAVAGAFTVVPALVAVLSWVVAFRAGRALRRASDKPPAGVPARRIARARFLAELGVWLDALSLLMIMLGGAAVITFGACAR